MNRSFSYEQRVGIDAIAVHVPRLYVDLVGEWATKRAAALGEPSVEALIGKVKKGVGVVEMAIPDAHEDSATLAAMAAVKVVLQAGIDPREIGTIAVGTETTVDQSKSIAAYVLGMLERRFGIDLREAGAPQFQFACIGATYALESTVNMFRARENTKPYGLVIATDVSRYPLLSPGEYTQGAGAVAMLISENPRLCTLDPRVAGTITRDERDFFRPNGMSTAVVDGKYSIDVYLDCMAEATKLFLQRSALEAKRKGADVRGERLDQCVDHLLFHAPFPRMAEYAALRIIGEAWRSDLEQFPFLQPLLEQAKSSGDTQAMQRAFEKSLATSAPFQEFFAARVAPSLTLAKRIGNIYSGSMYLGLASLLESSTDRSRLAGSRVGFFSYGSGASARVFSGVLVDPEKAYTPHILTELCAETAGGSRVALSLADYEQLHRGPLALEGAPPSLSQPLPSIRSAAGEFALTRIGAESSRARVDLGYRYYDWIPA